MACLLDAGIPEECDDSAGGLKQGSILIAQWDTIEDYTVTAGVVTAITQASGTFFYTFYTKNDAADFMATENHAPELGTNFEENIITFDLAKMSASKNVTYKLLSQKSCVIISEDMNGVFHIAGLERGADKIGSTRGSGRAMGDKNGYTIVFNDKSKNAYTVSSGVMATLDIDGIVS